MIRDNKRFVVREIRPAVSAGEHKYLIRSSSSGLFGLELMIDWGFQLLSTPAFSTDLSDISGLLL